MGRSPVAEEVKVVVSEERKGNAVADEGKRLKELEERGKRASRAGAEAGEKGGGGHGSKSGLLKGNARIVGDVLDTVTGGQGFVMKAMAVDRLPHIIEALGALAAPLGVLAAAVGTAAFYIDQKEQSYQEKRRVSEETAGDVRGEAVQESPLGSESGAFSAEVGDETNIEALKAKRAGLAHDARHSIWGVADNIFGTNIATQGLGWWKPGGARAIQANEDEIKRADEKRKADEQARRDLTATGTGLDLNIARDASEHNISGLKKGLVDKTAKIWLDTYKKYFSEGAGEKASSEAAGLAVKESERARALHASAGMVTASTGAAEAAAVARWSQGYMADPKGLQTEIAALHHTFRTGMSQLIGTQREEDFRR
jgi:hypothetical protein